MTPAAADGALFDLDALFDADYRHFYETLVPPERSQEEAALIAELLALQRGQRVLDVACGYGRLAAALTRLGAEVVGVDRSASLLGGASPGGGARSRGDMRALPIAGGACDALVCWFTSFGYFDDPTLRRTLAEFRRVVRSGGRVLIECLNRDAMLAGFQDVWAVSRGDDLLLDHNLFDPHTGRTEHEREIRRGGRVRRLHFAVRHFTLPELRDWLLGVGFDDVAAYGAEGELFDCQSERMIVVAR